MPTKQGASSAAYIAELYSKHRKAVRNRARRRLPKFSRHYAEDVVQETFSRTVNHINNGNSMRSPRAFLLTTVDNLIKTEFYGEQRPQDIFEATASMDDFAHSSASPERHAIERQQFDAVMSVVGQLPESCREAFVLKFVWGKTHEEIAQSLDITEGTSRNQVPRARKLLRGYYDERGIPFHTLFSED